MPWPRVIIHADMDQFYAAIEILDHPEHKGKPVIVGADPRGGRGRGVVSTASYEARAFGVHSALPISTAWKRCPQGIYLRPRMQRYLEVSEQVMAIFADFSAAVEPLSLDEAFLDVTGSRRLLGDGPTIARKIQQRIADEQGLVVSVGVAVTKSVAKIASDLRKPAGFVVVPPGKEQEFLDPLPIRRLWGVGPKAGEILGQLGIHRVHDLFAIDETLLRQRLGTESAKHVLAMGRGIDPRGVHSEVAAKSISHECTFDRDVSDRDELECTLLELADHVGRRARRHGLKGRTVQLKLRWHDFTTLTRADTHDPPTASGLELYARARTRLNDLLDLHPTRAVRLIGVGLSGFDEPVQGELFEDAPRFDPRLDQVADQIRQRFGERAIGPARLVRRRRERRGKGES